MDVAGTRVAGRRAAVRAAVLGLGLLAAAAGLAGPACAQSDTQKVPPANAMKLSALLQKVEGRDQFQYVSEVEWSEQGYYEITYFTRDKAKVEIKLDPVSGEPK